MQVQNPYLIQRAKIRRPLGDYRNKRISECVELDYMGSAEFEFGALPQSLRQFEADFANLKLRKVEEIMSGESALRVLSAIPDDQWEAYKAELIKLRANKGYTKEVTRFGADYKFTSTYFITDLWWDLDNSTMFSFDKNFMNHLKGNLQASHDFMNKDK